MSKTTLVSGWARISRGMLSGEGLEVPEAGVHIPGFLNLVTPHLPDEKMLEVLDGDIWVALFEQPEGGETHSAFFPGDEFVYVAAGAVTLTDGKSGDQTTFSAGEQFFVPKGWRGIWACPGHYREVAVCSRDWLTPYEKTFKRGILDSERRDAPLPLRRVELKEALADLRQPDASPGLRTTRIQGTDLVIRLVASERENTPATLEPHGDTFVRVLEGDVTLAGTDGGAETFSRDECFVVSGEFTGTWQFSSGYLGLQVGSGGAS